MVTIVLKILCQSTYSNVRVGYIKIFYIFLNSSAMSIDLL